AIRRRLGDPGGIAKALNAQIQLEWFRGRLGEQIKLAEEALPLAQEAGDIALEALLRYQKFLAPLFQSDRRARDDREMYETLEFARKHGHLALEMGIMNAIAHGH